MKKFLSIIMMFFLSISLALAEENKILPSQLGIIKSVEYVDVDNNMTEVKQVAEVELIKGEFKGKRVFIDNVLSGNPYYDIKLKKGTKVLLHVEAIDDELEFSIQDIQRSNTLWGLTLIFCSLLIYIGKKKGLFSLVSIVITCF